MPIGELCTVKSILAHDESVKWAAAGDNVEVRFTVIALVMLFAGY